ncbi:MAG: DUF7064 domain-containing protein [Candidatus Helarchaeota archaeon]
MMDKVLKYLKEKGIEIDEKLLKYVEKGVDISEEDEFKHDFGVFPQHHNESWYFNFVDRKSNVFLFSRMSMEMYDKKSTIMSVLIIDGKPNAYLNQIPLEKMPDNWEYDKRLKFICVKPMKQWRIKFEDRKFKLDVTFDARFPVFNYLSHEDPLAAFEKYGVELLDVAAQQHYEQGMKVTGTLVMKKTGETRKIDCLGHRDHSWGTRDWVTIDRWNWVSAQFEDKTINIARVEVLGKILQTGFISTENGNVHIKQVDVSTKTEEDGKTPVSSTFSMIDENGNKTTITTSVIKSIHLQLPSPRGQTEIFEQIVTFTCNGSEGDGISEYLISVKK